MTDANIDIIERVVHKVTDMVIIPERIDKARLEERVFSLERENDMLREIIRNLTTGGNKNDT